MEEIIKYFTDQGISRELAIAYLVVSALIVIMAVVVIVMRIILFFRYNATNNIRTSSHKTSVQVAREALDKCGLSHIQVKKAGFFRAWFFGNCYSITKKTIFLRRGIYDKDSLTAVGMALQKVGVAKMCEENKSGARIRNVMQILALFGPFLFLPIVLAGFLIDLFVFANIGLFSTIGLAVGLFIMLSGFIVTMLNIPVEKKANDMALKMLSETNILNEEELSQVKKVFDTYIIAYVCEFLVTVLRIVQIVLEIVMNSQIKNNNG